MDLESLESGTIIVNKGMEISPAMADPYLLAVGAERVLYTEHQLAPPMAIATFALAAAMEAARLPSGAIHTGQEVTFVSAIPATSSLHCIVRVVQNSVRRGARFLTFHVEVNCDGQLAIEGQTSLVIPEDAATRTEGAHPSG